MWWLIGSIINLFVWIVVLTAFSNKYERHETFHDFWPGWIIGAVATTLFWPIAYPVAVSLFAFIAGGIYLGRWVFNKWLKKESK